MSTEAMKLALDELLAEYDMENSSFAKRVDDIFKEALTQPLTPREIELIDGMIEVQLDHAARCDNIANRTMAEKQKGWDMERVELLRKLKGDA